jgi:hypothetical protein
MNAYEERDFRAMRSDLKAEELVLCPNIKNTYKDIHTAVLSRTMLRSLAVLDEHTANIFRTALRCVEHHPQCHSTYLHSSENVTFCAFTPS